MWQHVLKQSLVQLIRSPAARITAQRYRQQARSSHGETASAASSATILWTAAWSLARYYLSFSPAFVLQPSCHFL